VLTALLEDRLFTTTDQQVVIAAPGDENAETRDLVDPVTPEAEGVRTVREPDQDRHQQPVAPVSSGPPSPGSH
jgi:hypothetical protein